jgi:hypothetical protein
MARIRAESVGEALRAVGGERLPGTTNGEGTTNESKRRVRLTGREALARRLWEQALGGDLAASRLVLEYTEGKPVQRIAAQVRGCIELMPPLTDEELAGALAALAEWVEERR